MYPRFGLTLMVTHACNMRCTYCYVGTKYPRSMPPEIGMCAIDRALASLEPGGTRELGFFGGEPTLEAALVLGLMDYAESRTIATGKRVTFGMTTNATVAGGESWALMTYARMELSVSFDGLPDIHDRHRRFADGRSTSATVLDTIRRLLEAAKEFRVVAVVRPDGVEQLAQGIEFLRSLGVRHVDLTLDLWATWKPEDAFKLVQVVGEAAQVWRDGLPECSVNWFDEKAALLAGVPANHTARCGFGDGAIAVAPSGNLYPCERLIGEDAESNPMRLPGHALAGNDFVRLHAAPARFTEACSICPAASLCNTTCRCSNYVRTSNPATPDRFLCLFNQACLHETAKLLGKPLSTAAPVNP